MRSSGLWRSMRLPWAPPPSGCSSLTIHIALSSGERAPTARRQPGILMHVHPVLPGVPRGALPAPAGGSTVRPARFEERARGRLHCFRQSRALVRLCRRDQRNDQLGTRWRARRAAREPSDYESGSQSSNLFGRQGRKSDLHDVGIYFWRRTRTTMVNTFARISPDAVRRVPRTESPRPGHARSRVPIRRHYADAPAAALRCAPSALSGELDGACRPLRNAGSW